MKLGSTLTHISVMCRKLAFLLGIGCLTVFSCGLIFQAQATTHAWTGRGGNRLWSEAENWSYINGFPSVPDGGLYCSLQFPPNTGFNLNTNDLGNYVYFNGIEIQGHYELYGDSVYLDYLSGQNSTVYFDILPDYPGPWNGAAVGLTIYASPGSDTTLTIAGNIVRSGGNTNMPVRLLGNGNLILSGVINGRGDLYKTNGGDVTLQGSAANTFTGTTYMHAGILRLNKIAVIPPGITVGRVSVPGPLVIGNGTNGLTSDIVWLGYHSQIADTSEVTIYASGQLDLNNYSDTIGPLTMTGGSVVTGIGTLTLNGDVVCKPAANVSGINGKLALGSGIVRRFIVDTGAQMQVDAVVSGGSGIALVKTNVGELILTAANTYDGPTLVAGGTLTVMHAQALGGKTNGTTLQGGTLQIDSVSVSNEVLTVEGHSQFRILEGGGTCGWWGTVILSNSLCLYAPSTGDTLTVGGALTGVGDLIKTGLGTVRLSGTSPNTFSGDCFVKCTLELGKAAGLDAVPGMLRVGDGAGGTEADEVKLFADEQIADTSAVEVTTSGFLNLNGRIETIGQLTGNGAVSLGSGALTVSNTIDHTFSGAIRGGKAGFTGADVTKDGSGTWTLSGSNTYWGTTYVKGGTLLVNGTLANSTSEISRGGTLGGTGTVQAVTFSGTGGKLAPGMSAGKLTAHGAVTLSGGTLEVELNGLTSGSGYDQLVTDLTPTLGKGASSLSVLLGFTPPMGSSFVILSNRSASAVSGNFAGKAQGAKFAAGGLLFQISYTGGDGNDVVLTRVPSPAVTNLTAQFTNNQVRVRAQGIAGVNYVIEAAPSLNVPVALGIYQHQRGQRRRLDRIRRDGPLAIRPALLPHCVAVIAGACLARAMALLTASANTDTTKAFSRAGRSPGPEPFQTSGSVCDNSAKKRLPCGLAGFE